MLLRLTVVLLAASAARAENWQHKSSAFQAVRWSGETPIVRYESAWYELLSVHGKSAKEIIEFCQTRYRDRWQKRFVEDLGQVLDEIGTRPAKHVTLVLKPMPNGKSTSVQAPMTFALRQQAKTARFDQPFVAIKRMHGSGNPKYADLAKRVKPDRHSSRDVLTLEEAASDLDELEGLMAGAYSYLKRTGVDYKAALDTIRAGLGKGIEKATFALQLRKFLALFGDGHSDVRGSLGGMGGRSYPPLLFGEVGTRIFAFKEDRTGLFDEEHPYVVSFDDVPLAKWLEAARGIGARGSPQLIRRNARRNLRYVGYLRQVLGVRHRDAFYLELASATGAKKRHRLKLQGGRAMYGTWPRTKTRVLDGKIGYLRLDRMGASPRFVRELEGTMQSFKDTRGLIIDVRGNGGGSRHALRVLAAYFMTDKEPPRVANVAKYRLPKWEGKETSVGHMDNRWLYPAGWPDWSKEERAVIKKHSAGFKPEWKLPTKGFTKWHYMLLDRKAARQPFVYRERVVILMDGGCYSATDIFLGAFKGWAGVTLVGTPSGGGSGRVRGITLAASGLELRLSTMASFQANGKLYDGNGIHPDIVVEPDIGDWHGRGDKQLQKAMKLLR